MHDLKHFHHYHLIRLTELRRLYWAHTVKLLASNMALIFVPIYLYQLDYNLTHIFGYFFIWAAVWLVVQHPVLKLSNAIGFNRAMALGLMLQGIHILMLATIPVFHWPLWLIAIVWSVETALYWPNFRACFAKSLLHRKVGPSVGLSAALTTLAYGAAPVIGGATATVFGISVLYGIAFILFVAAGIPLFSSKEIIKRHRFKLRDFSWSKARRDLFSNAGNEIDDDILSTIWPLFIFLLIPSYIGVGALSSIAVIGGIVIALYVGRRQEFRGTSRYLKRGTAIVALANGARMLSQSAASIAGANIVHGLGHALMETPYYSRYYQNAEREPLLPYVYAMMVASAVGAMALYGTLLLLSLFLPVQTVLLAGLFLAIPASFVMQFIRQI